MDSSANAAGGEAGSERPAACQNRRMASLDAESGGPSFRPATADDVEALASTLAKAFFDDPVSMWACPRDSLRERVLERFHGARLRQLVSSETVWTDEARTCAAVWARPDRWRTSVRDDVEIAAAMVHPRLLARMPLVARGLLGVERRHPQHPPHWYLAVLGTHPGSQGRGLGSAALSPVLSECDGDGVAAYLESSKEQNIDFYARHGFRVTRELRLPRGPKLWAMWRDPRR